MTEDLQDMELKTIKKQYNKLGILYIIGTVFCTVSVYAVILSVTKFFPSITKNTDLMTIVQMLPRFLIAYPVFIAIIRFMPKMKIPEKKMGAGKMTASFFMVYTAGILANVVGVVFLLVFGILKKLLMPGLPQMTMPGLSLIDILTGLSTVWQIVFVVILAPIFEELLFRKLLIDRIYGYSEIAAILLSGFMFGLFHKNLQQFIYATVIGIIFAYIYIRTGRLRYSIILHMLINFMGSVVVGGIFKLAGLGEYVQAYMNALSTGDFSAVLKFANDNMDALMILGAFEMVIGAVILTGIILWIVAFAKKSFHLVH